MVLSATAALLWLFSASLIIIVLINNVVVADEAVSKSKKTTTATLDSNPNSKLGVNIRDDHSEKSFPVVLNGLGDHTTVPSNAQTAIRDLGETVEFPESSTASSAEITSEDEDEANHPKRRNLLFIMDESIRPDDLPMFGGLRGVAPNLQGFFSRPGSILVDQAHADYPLCNPSRTSLLLGRSPDSTGIKTNYMNWNRQPGAKTWKSLPRFLKEQGYVTLLGGKVFHHGTNDARAWSVVFDRKDDIDHGQCRKDRQSLRVILGNGKFAPYSVGCMTTSFALPDLALAQKAVRQLTNLRRKQPHMSFAMFIGFQLPHFPLRVNQKYMLDRARIDARIPTREPPRNAREYKVTYSLSAPKHIARRRRGPGDSEIPAFIKEGTDAFSAQGPQAIYRENLRQLHISGVTQTDGAFGIIIRALDSLGLSNNTLVVFTGDHGYAYGETRLCEKDLPMDIATRIPLMFHVPWERRSRRPGTRFFINSLDVYRTVAGFLGLKDKLPSTKVVEGRDLSRQLTGAGRATSSAAYSQVVRCSVPSNCRGTLKGIDVVGYTVRTHALRYIVYLRARDGRVRNFTQDNIIAEELYDHSRDRSTIFNPRGARFVGHEFRNVAQGKARTLRSMFSLIQARFGKRGRDSESSANDHERRLSEDDDAGQMLATLHAVQSVEDLERLLQDDARH